MLRLISFFLMMAVAGSAFSANAWVTGKVTRTLIDDTYFGGCMIVLLPGPETLGLNCPAVWVTLNCSGDYNSKEVGYQKLQAAQLALVTGTTVHVWVDDTKKHNGYCYARRIDNLSY